MDNAKYFKKAQRILQRLFKTAGISNPWMEGVFECLIQSIERCLKKVLKTVVLSEDEIQTIVIE